MTDPFLRAAFGRGNGFSNSRTAERQTPSAKPPKTFTTQTHTPQKPDKSNVFKKVPDALIEKMDYQDRQFKRAQAAYEHKRFKTAEKYPALTKFLDAISRNEKTTGLVEGGILDTDFTDIAIKCGLRDCPVDVRRIALTEFHELIWRKNKAAGLSGGHAPMPWDEVSDLEVMKKVLRLT